VTQAMFRLYEFPLKMTVVAWRSSPQRYPIQRFFCRGACWTYTSSPLASR
jgi:hypothetical protein